jgi:hypothetical protein
MAVEYLSVSEAAEWASEALGWPVPPRAISDLFYQRRLDRDCCPLVGRFRFIPRSYLPQLRQALEQLREKRREKDAGAAE